LDGFGSRTGDGVVGDGGREGKRKFWRLGCLLASTIHWLFEGHLFHHPLVLRFSAILVIYLITAAPRLGTSVISHTARRPAHKTFGLRFFFLPFLPRPPASASRFPTDRPRRGPISGGPRAHSGGAAASLPRGPEERGSAPRSARTKSEEPRATSTTLRTMMKKLKPPPRTCSRTPPPSAAAPPSPRPA
jgi:hypothetical protein